MHNGFFLLQLQENCFSSSRKTVMIKWFFSVVDKISFTWSVFLEMLNIKSSVVLSSDQNSLFLSKNVRLYRFILNSAFTNVYFAKA